MSYFLALTAYMFTTGDTVAWEAMTSPDCTFCNSMRETLGEIQGAGASAEWLGLRMEAASTAEYRDHSDVWGWYFDFTDDAFRDIDASGAVTAQSEARSIEYLGMVMWRDNRWLIHDLGPWQRPADVAR